MKGKPTNSDPSEGYLVGGSTLMCTLNTKGPGKKLIVPSKGNLVDPRSGVA